MGMDDRPNSSWVDFIHCDARYGEVSGKLSFRKVAERVGLQVWCPSQGREKNPTCAEIAKIPYELFDVVFPKISHIRGLENTMTEE
jgi:hypothetical protein